MRLWKMNPRLLILWKSEQHKYSVVSFWLKKRHLIGKHFILTPWFSCNSSQSQLLHLFDVFFFFILAMRETKEALESVSMSLVVLQEGEGTLNFNLSHVRDSINLSLDDPGCRDEESDATTAQLCRSIRQSLSQLQISANFTRVWN